MTKVDTARIRWARSWAYSQKESTIEPPSGLPSNPARELARSFNIRVIIFLLLHMPLALVMELVPLLSTAHAIIVLLYGLRAALMGRTTKVIYSVAYARFASRIRARPSSPASP